ncbi:MAG: hypothetical protein M3Q69_19595, partial [Acidobacteriota bacterium]|nr:hypothetical protein [Acidobacteriota bacterium]
SPLVHIRAVPEGGTAGERAANPHLYKVNFPRTFYGRYQRGASSVSNARQPLPTVFAARWLSGGTATFDTDMIIWREGTAGPNARCAVYRDVPSVAEAVTFDDQENAAAFPRPDAPIPTPILRDFTLPSAGRHTMRGTFPMTQSYALSGWLYLNLNLARQPPPEPLQAWVVISMRAEGRHSVSMDAAMLGNGCSPPLATSEVSWGNAIIGPLPNATP